MPNSITVTITDEVHVDPYRWAAEYGVPLDQVEDDVREYFGQGQLQEHLRSLGLAAPERDPLLPAESS